MKLNYSLGKQTASTTLSLFLFSSLIFFSTSSPVQAKDALRDFNFSEFEQNPKEVTHDFVVSKSPKTGTFSRKETVKHPNQVGVVGFQVVFSENTVEQIEGSTWKGLTQGSFTDSRWELQVMNMTPDVRQKIAESLYQEFKNHLSKTGFEIVPQERIIASQNYKNFVQETTLNDKNVINQTQRPTKFGGNTVWTAVPAGFPIEKLDLSSDIFAGAKPGFLSGFQQTGNAFGKMGQMGSISQAYQDFTDFAPISVTYFVDLKKQKAIGSFLPGNPFGSSKRDSLFGLSVSPGSYVRFYTRLGDNDNKLNQRSASQHQLNFVLKHPVQSTDPVGEIRFDKENIGTQALGMAANFALRSMGAPGIAPALKVRKYELTIDPTTYTLQAERVLDTVNKMMVIAIGQEVLAPKSPTTMPSNAATTPTADTPIAAPAVEVIEPTEKINANDGTLNEINPDASVQPAYPLTPGTQNANPTNMK
jgi:hypothetical protein